MRVMMFNRFQFGGETGHVLSLSLALKKLGCHPSLVMAGYPPLLRKRIQNYLYGLDHFFVNGDEEYERLAAFMEPAILHVHTPGDFGRTAALANRFQIQWVATVHGGVQVSQGLKQELSTAHAVICTERQAARNLAGVGRRVVHLPEGIDLKRCAPGGKGGVFTITFAGHVNRKSMNGFNAFCKAVDLLDKRVFNVIANVNPPSINAHFRGWLFTAAGILATSDVVAGNGRFVLEGLAAGNAAFILGEKYQGLITPENAARLLDLSGLTGEEPCYRHIFVSLSELYKERDKLRALQAFGRRVICENHDQRIIAEKTISLYREVLRGTQGDIS